jgi:hypothetical protein
MIGRQAGIAVTEGDDLPRTILTASTSSQTFEKLVESSQSGALPAGMMKYSTLMKDGNKEHTMSFRVITR